ncbi:Restriction endonuclease S subunit [Mucilaginibacter pineti]|uniref:Restriction endonuclease S subunit n=1 Tax=Mucilaginibacter pineti TaxID=1391627 RepID=A0A1G7NIB1_9SPHI|nr:restriction endonuclease subunit S [Mucilaginibacter pineti]SDF73818.1 Restriction endonuclease S subunit [Mucilaginibacter pineti]
MVKNWKTLPLKDLIISRKGRKPLKLLDYPFPDSVPYLDIDAIANKNVKQFADHLTTLISTSNDILIVADGSRSGLVNKSISGAVGSTMLCITPLAINSNFLFHFLKSQYHYFNKNTKGSSIPHLNLKLLEELQVPIPHPVEQEFIAKFLDSKMDEHNDQFIAAIEEVKRLKELRTSVLDRAINGELTAKWRESNVYSEADVILKLKNLNAKFRVYNKTDLRFTLPENWIITDVCSICSKVTDGEHSTPPRFDEGELLLSARNVRDGYIDYENVDFISKEDLLKLRTRCNPEVNDVLVVSVGATIGRTAIVTEKKLFALVRSVLLLKPLISGEYLMYCLQSSILQNFIRESTKGVAQGHLYITETNLLPIPFPIIAEQEEIIRQVRLNLNTADLLLKKSEDAANKVETLRNSIFQLAFSGRISEMPDIYKNDSSWFEDFRKNLETQRIKLLDAKSKNLVKNKSKSLNFRNQMAQKKSIVDLLISSPNNESTVENAWHQSVYYEKGQIEQFYEELERVCADNETGRIVIWEFSNNQKNSVILKFK